MLGSDEVDPISGARKFECKIDGRLLNVCLELEHSDSEETDETDEG